MTLFASIQSFLLELQKSDFSAIMRSGRLFGGFLVLLFSGLILLLLVKVQVLDNWLKTLGSFVFTHTFPKRHLNKSWQKILLRLTKSDEANLKLALIEADNLFDNLLKDMGLKGESMADRLKLLDSSKIPNIDEIWRAHKLRNTLVHNHEYSVTRDEIDFGIKAYEKALKDLEFID